MQTPTIAQIRTAIEVLKKSGEHVNHIAAIGNEFRTSIGVGMGRSLKGSKAQLFRIIIDGNQSRQRTPRRWGWGPR
jgi:hypothetical protein